MKMLLTLTLLVAAHAQAADILALCIGNNNYTRVEDQLDTPVNDATLMKSTLEKLPGGADVILVTDATKEKMELALNSFKAKATNEQVKLALFYYSGHGVEDQPEGFTQSETFLLPTDAVIEDVNQLTTRAVSVSSVLERLKAMKTTVRAVLLDCCRSGAPKATGALAGKTKSFSSLDDRVKQSLGKAVVPDATLVAFAASPGRKAAAFLSESDANSPFTTFVSQQLLTSTKNLRDLVEDAAEITEKRTERLQVPFVNYVGAPSAIRQLVFRGKPAQLPPSAPVPQRAPIVQNTPPAQPLMPIYNQPPAPVKQSAETDAEKIRKAKFDLALINSELEKHHNLYLKNLGIINRMTAYKTRPVRQGSPEALQCEAASKVIQEAERVAAQKVPERDKLEALIKALGGTLDEPPASKK